MGSSWMKASKYLLPMLTILWSFDSWFHWWAAKVKELCDTCTLGSTLMMTLLLKQWILDEKQPHTFHRDEAENANEVKWSVQIISCTGMIPLINYCIWVSREHIQKLVCHFRQLCRQSPGISSSEVPWIDLGRVTRERREEALNITIIQ